MVLPLGGTKILDLTRLAPGPYCTMILADLGADVLKIEEPGAPTGRRAEQQRQAPSGITDQIRALPFNPLNRNKRSLAFDLKTEAGRQIFYKLAGTADVVVEEFRPGVARRLGIDYETLKPLNSRLIYCAITGYGQTGPYRDLVGHDINYISIAGALSLIGQKGAPPAIPQNVLADFAGGGMHGAIGILTALVAREKTGKGQLVDISMTDGVVSLMTMLYWMYAATGELPERGNTTLSGAIPQYNVYQTLDGKYISLGSVEPWFYANLCRALGREDLIPHADDLGQKRQEIFDYFRRVFLTRTRDEWFQLLSRTDICVSPVLTLDELSSNPQLQARQMFVDFEHPSEGKVRQTGISVRLSETPGSIRSLAPRTGEHTNEVLLELGYSADEIGALRQSRVIK